MAENNQNKPTRILQTSHCVLRQTRLLDVKLGSKARCHKWRWYSQNLCIPVCRGVHRFCDISESSSWSPLLLQKAAASSKVEDPHVNLKLCRYSDNRQANTNFLLFHMQRICFVTVQVASPPSTRSESSQIIPQKQRDKNAVEPSLYSTEIGKAWNYSSAFYQVPHFCCCCLKVPLYRKSN